MNSKREASEATQESRIGQNNRPLQTRWVPIETVTPYHGNPRTHSDEQIAQIAASITEFGWTNPILIRPNYVLIAGEGRLEAARKLGFTEIPVIEVGRLTDAQYRALAIADNQLALNAGWDEDRLNEEIAALAKEEFDTTLMGFDDDELVDRLAALDRCDDIDPDEGVPNPTPMAVSAPGDIWLLGAHRLMCGDATVADDVSILMQPRMADLIFLDPSYNVDYEGYTKERLKIANDRMTKEQYKEFLLRAFESCRRFAKPTASLYTCHASSWQREVQDAMEAAGFQVRCQIVWAKNSFAWGFSRYKFQHEPLFYAHVRDQSDPWYGDKTQSTLWLIDKPTANREHPTMKPVELIERALINSSRAGDTILDLFGGSGSTLIACERLKRKACLMEIDPRYVDVIVRRWQAYCGKEAKLERSEQTYEQVCSEGRKRAA
jgi:DNA modification methylase